MKGATLMTACTSGQITTPLTVNGINIVIYDPELKLVIDSIGVNVYNGTDVLREADLTAD
jgi:hypothetical protein